MLIYSIKGAVGQLLNPIRQLLILYFFIYLFPYQTQLNFLANNCELWFGLLKIPCFRPKLSLKVCKSDLSTCIISLKLCYTSIIVCEKDCQLQQKVFSNRVLL